MAKKKSSRSGFNMSAAVREVLSENPNFKGKEVSAALRERYPTAEINESSLQVAFSNARRQLGIGKSSKKAVRVRKPVATPSLANVDLNHLQAAREFVAKIGDPQAAIAAVTTLVRLQIR